MKALILKYLGLIFGIYLIFTQVVACGGEMYRVNMKSDHEAGSVPSESNDQNSAQYGIHATGGWRNLPIDFEIDSKLNQQQINGLKRAMITWEIAVGKKLFLQSGFDPRNGDDFANLADSLQDSVNGHYGNHDWSKTSKPQEVLATTVWRKSAQDQTLIDTADIRFNLQYYAIGNTLDYGTEIKDNQVAVDMETLALHELGHLLGLSHIDQEVDRFSIMLPVVYIGFGMYNRRLTIDDIKRIQSIYGCSGDACDIEATHDKLEQRAFDQVEPQAQLDPLEDSDTATH